MNETNLRALAKLLREMVKPEHFDMLRLFKQSDYRHDPSPFDIKREQYNECGTVACALGHAPLLFLPEKDEDWDEYCYRVFGIESSRDLEWDFLFGACWQRVDNTPEGAAKRIDYLLKHGCPDQEDINAMQLGEMELCYA